MGLIPNVRLHGFVVTKTLSLVIPRWIFSVNRTGTTYADQIWKVLVKRYRISDVHPLLVGLEFNAPRHCTQLLSFFVLFCFCLPDEESVTTRSNLTSLGRMLT